MPRPDVSSDTTELIRLAQAVCEQSERVIAASRRLIAEPRRVRAWVTETRLESPSKSSPLP